MIGGIRDRSPPVIHWGELEELQQGGALLLACLLPGVLGAALGIWQAPSLVSEHLSPIRAGCGDLLLYFFLVPLVYLAISALVLSVGAAALGLLVWWWRGTTEALGVTGLSMYLGGPVILLIPAIYLLPTWVLPLG